MDNRFIIYTLYNGEFDERTESTNDIIAALEAVAIYLRDPDCCHACIEDLHTGEIILRYWQE